ncbi:MAG: succinylglutamate desuccinylase/aspartoacylase family protein [Halioglobus sp.]|nr:succinylglutamate desuccinylase/aspartoacylase family protein [Halioglobus sp.]
MSDEELRESANIPELANERPPAPADSGAFAPDQPPGKATYTVPPPELDASNALMLLGRKVPPGTSTRLAWSPRQSLDGLSVPTPVLVVNGAGNGPTLCLTAAVHGDELNGIEIVRRVLYNLDPEELSGAVIGVPIVNLQGFRRTSRYLTDRRDLNRFFPGNPTGSSASRIAHSFFNEVVKHCDALVDLHTGSFHRTNLPQLRADLENPAILALSQGFGSTVVLQSKGAPGTLRRAAAEHGIPAVTLEAGAPQRLNEEDVSSGVAGVETLLRHMKLKKGPRFWGNPEPVYYQSRWVRADRGGVLLSRVSLGEEVDEGDLLGTVTDPITNMRADILSPFRGRVLGMALNQVVLPGFAAYHIGIQASDTNEGASDDEEQSPEDDFSSAEDGVSGNEYLAE